MAAHEHLPDLVVTAINSVPGDSEQLLVFLRKWTGASERELLLATLEVLLSFDDRNGHQAGGDTQIIAKPEKE